MEREKASSLLFLICLGFVLSVESVRTHERFSQSSYYSTPDVVVIEKPVDVKSWTPTEDKNSIPGVESKEESRKDLMPTEVQQTENNIPQRYVEHRGTYATTGDFTADARPWWFNPQYSNYGNSPLGNQPTDRYPSTFDPRYFKNYQNPRGMHQGSRNYAQYTKTSNGDAVPYELTGGGCPTQYWISNTHRWPSFFNIKSTIGDAFGTPATEVYGEKTILQALLDAHDDGYNSLARNGCTAVLNAYSRSQYKYSHQKVIEIFNSALVSNKAAAQQAAMFDEANMSALSEQYNSCA